MTGEFRRGCVVVAAAALLVMTGAQPAVHGDDHSAELPAGHAVPAWTYDPDEPIHPDDLAARMRDENVPAEVAAKRFRVERAVSVLRRNAAQRWPETFGGMWIDTGSFDVRAAFTTGAAANVARLAGEFPFPEVLVPVTVAHSLAALRAVQHALRDDTALTAAVGRYDTDIDLETNQVVIRFPSVTPEVRERVWSAYGTVVAVREGVARPSSCGPAECTTTMYGGLDMNHGAVPCTTAFTAAIGSYRYALSAGHCYANTGVADVLHNGIYYGSVTAHRVGGRTDVERVRRFGGWRESSKFEVLGEKPRDVKRWLPYADVGKGDYVGKTGNTSWTTRGYVVSVEYEPTFFIPGSYDFVVADYCAEIGDSGGPVWSSTTAIGIHAFTVSGECRITNGRPNPSQRGIFGSIEFAISAMGVTLLSGVNATPTSFFQWNCDLVMKCDFNGLESGDDDGLIASYLWNFGDGSTSTLAMPTHSYAVPGRYTVSLTVRDNDGAAAVKSAIVDHGIGGQA